MSLTLQQASAPQVFGLLDLADRLLTPPTPIQVAAVALEIGLPLAGMHAGAIDLADRPGGALRPLARQGSLGSSHAVWETMRPLTSNWEALRLEGDGAVIACGDLTSAANGADATKTDLVAAGAIASASTPLVVDGGAIGLFTFFSGTPRDFSPADLDLFRAIARITALSIERSRQHVAAQRRIERLGAISDTQRSIAESKSKTDLIGTVAQNLERIADATWLDVTLFSEGTNVIQLVHSRRDGFPVEHISTSEMAALAGIAARVGDRRQPLLRHASDSDDVRIADASLPVGVLSELIVPMFANDRAMGVLRFASAKPFAYTEQDVDTFAMLALQIAEALQELRQRELKDEFMSIVCHELRGPLTAISGYAQLLERHLVSSTARQGLLDDVRSIRASASRLSDLIDDLTDLTRLETGRLRLKLSLIDPVALAEKVVADLSHSTDATSLRVVVQSPVRRTVADGHRVEQVLSNLVNNAVKYSSPTSAVRVVVSDDGDSIRFSVQDQGVGIKTSELPHVFERFFRASNAAHIEGFGLGLYISRMLVEAIGGRITAESQSGSGSLFTFTVPVVLPEL